MNLRQIELDAIAHQNGPVLRGEKPQDMNAFLKNRFLRT